MFINSINLTEFLSSTLYLIVDGRCQCQCIWIVDVFLFQYEGRLTAGKAPLAEKERAL